MSGAARLVAATLRGTLVVLACAWLGGLAWFVATLGQREAEPDATTDAIVVLTGGRGRLEAGLDLLQQGKGRKLFVSGVHRGVSVDSLTRQLPDAQRWNSCCIVLGHEAADTAGNAVETARWLAAEQYRSLRLVTADYHMRRALLELHRVLPDEDLVVPEPVASGGLHAWRAAPVVVVEYLKYLGALVRPLLAPHPGPAP